MDMNKAQQLRQGVQQAYSAAAENPHGQHPFPVGRAFAESLGYPLEVLNQLPAVAVDAFAGVSNVALFAQLPVGATVLDLGCGAGLDALIAAGRVGPTGHVIGIDFSQSMLQRARQAAAEAGITQVEFRQAGAENLPLDSATVDVVLANGIFNLNPARKDIFSELGRVVRPGGAVYAAEIILNEPLPPEVQASESNWFAWIAGAKEGGTFLAEFRAAGFGRINILRTMRNARTKNSKVVAVEVYACR